MTTNKLYKIHKSLKKELKTQQNNSWPLNSSRVTIS